MAPPKHKQPRNDPDRPPRNAAAPDSTRRGTRQTPIPPPPIPTSQSQSQSQAQTPAPIPAAENNDKGRCPSSTSRPQLRRISETPIPIPVLPFSCSNLQPRPNPPPAPTTTPEPRATRQKTGTAAAASDTPATMGAAVKEAKDSVRPVTLVAPKITYQASQAQPHRKGGSLVRPSPPTSQPPITSHFRPVPRSSTYHHNVPATVTAVPVPMPPTPATATAANTSTPKQQHQQQHHQPAASNPKPAESSQTPRTLDKSAPRIDRNIDKVILGNICFKAWYPSYYGKDVLGGDASASAKTANVGSGKNPLPSEPTNAGAKNSQRKGTETPILDRLYVCPMCFKYSKELVTWWGHVRMCEEAGTVPGRKVYVHPRGQRSVRREVPRSGGKKGNVAVKFTEEIVTDEGEWSVWEVDGEQDVLFCQNLSLFAKLFLDNKSVFFDVRGFNYFLLVYTPPPSKPDSTEPHIVGFFSKEKMSWDNNNLACILVFPPWQRKGLGALLMGVSYAISRREGILGGPEKPISELGRKGYRRFWGGEIARWLLGCPTNDVEGVNRTLLVDVEDCCKATWIAPDDCLVTLREMGLVVEDGMGPGKPAAKAKRDADEDGEDVEMVDVGGKVEEEPNVARVKVDKEAVLAWVLANKISLERMCDPQGFVEGYAMKEEDDRMDVN